VKVSLKELFPVIDWLPQYPRKNFRWDLVAGITMAFFLIPISMAYASLANLPPQTGIYCSIFAGIFYFIFGTSKHLSIGPTSAISLIVGTTVARLSIGDPGEALALASMTALIMAVLFLVAWLIRLSSLVSFISDTILIGFKAGAALVIASTQFSRLFGLHDEGGDFFKRIGFLVQHIGDTHPEVLLFGLIALGMLILGHVLFPDKPVSLVVVIASILVVSFTSLKDSGLELVGAIPSGIPPLRFPNVNSATIHELTVLSMACFLLAYLESISAARALAHKNSYEVDPKQELLALGTSNLAASLSSAYPVAGGLGQSTINESSGARSQLALIITSGVLMICLLFLTRFFQNLPEVVLAVIILHAITGLINIKEMKHLFRVSRYEFWIMIVTIIAVLFLGILDGVLIAILLSIAVMLSQTSSPHIAILGRIKKSNRFSDMLRHPENEPVPGLLILRVESSILYFNISYIHDHIREIIRNYPGELKMVIMDLSSANWVDLSGARFLVELEDELEKKGIRYKVVEALGRVRDILRAEGIEQEIGHISRKVDLEDVVKAYLKDSRDNE
jgi:high affinity sulfate transporter 1